MTYRELCKFWFLSIRSILGSFLLTNTSLHPTSLQTPTSYKILQFDWLLLLIQWHFHLIAWLNRWGVGDAIIRKDPYSVTKAYPSLYWWMKSEYTYFYKMFIKMGHLFCSVAGAVWVGGGHPAGYDGGEPGQQDPADGQVDRVHLPRGLDRGRDRGIHYRTPRASLVQHPHRRHEGMRHWVLGQLADGVIGRLCNWLTDEFQNSEIELKWKLLFETNEIRFSQRWGNWPDLDSKSLNLFCIRFNEK